MTHSSSKQMAQSVFQTSLQFESGAQDMSKTGAGSHLEFICLSLAHSTPRNALQSGPTLQAKGLVRDWGASKQCPKPEVRDPQALGFYLQLFACPFGQQRWHAPLPPNILTFLKDNVPLPHFLMSSRCCVSVLKNDPRNPKTLVQRVSRERCLGW